jgi:ATP-dependent Clp protease ATP-binding subunit ClpC
VTGRNLPDKAIDLIDEAGARARIQAMTRPPDVKNIEAELQEVKQQKELAIARQEYERAAALRDREREIKTSYEQTLSEWEQTKADKQMTVGAEEIAYIVSKWTGVPVAKLEEAESAKLLRMEEELAKRVVGQEEAIRAISKSLRRARADIKDPRRPIGSFVFLGPTGVGKTLLAKALAAFMFGDEDAMIALDMSEYMEKFAVSRLTGSPPGYVGYEEGGQLTEAVRRKPYSVVLFDEIEKAHPDVTHILLQVLEEGKLTDNFGRVVDFRNTVVIMTSNIGADLLKKDTTVGFGAERSEHSYEGMKTKIMDEVKRIFKPEFLNRLDDTIVFRPLEREHFNPILDIELGKVRDRLKRQGVRLEVTNEAREFLIDRGFDEKFGARPLRRAIERHLEDALAEEILRGALKGRDVLTVKVEGDRLVFA